MQRLWVQAAGWLVMAMGFVEIITGLRLRSIDRGIPLFVILGILMIGAAFVLAGQALGEGYAWPLPLCTLSFGLGLHTLIIGYAVYRASRAAIQRGVLRLDVPQNARNAYMLWVGGFACVMLGIILSWEG